MILVAYFKQTIQGVLSVFGLKLLALPTEKDKLRQAEVERQKTLWLRKLGIKTVLDIGANTGQFAQLICDILPGVQLYSFEPLSDCYKELVQNLASYEKFKAFNLALANYSGQTLIERNQYSPSSSMLTMGQLHKECFPYAQEVVTQEIQVARLDDLASNLILEPPILIKVDVQGFEDQVIAGGQTIFQQASVLIIEMSVAPLYENQPLFDSIYQTLINLGFRYKGNYSQLLNPQDGSVLQVDAIFQK